MRQRAAALALAASMAALGVDATLTTPAAEASGATSRVANGLRTGQGGKGAGGKDARAILRYALPVQSKAIRAAQVPLEEVQEQLKLPGAKYGKVLDLIAKSAGAVGNKGAVLADTPQKNKADVEKLLGEIQGDLTAFKEHTQARLDSKDGSLATKALIRQEGERVLGKIGQVEQLMVEKFPFEVPAAYDNLPRLLGRATVEIQLKYDDPARGQGGTMTMTVDGFSAPVNAGAFVDLVDRGFYNGMRIQRSDGFVVQTGNPEGKADGFIPPGSSEVRRLPLEVLAAGDKEPVYEESLSDQGRYLDPPVLPFNAFGTVAMARSDFAPNDASSQFFILLKEAELTPSGLNLLDGNYSVIGYITDNVELLEKADVGDTIVSAKIVTGKDALVRPKGSAPAPVEGETAEDAPLM